MARTEKVELTVLCLIHMFKVDLVSDFTELLQVMLDEKLTEFQYVATDGNWKVI